MAISNVIKSVQDIMRQDAGVDGDAQRISQLVWMIFLKVFDSKESEWELYYDDYEQIVPKGLRWRDWAEDDEGITGDTLLAFINNKLFPTLKDLEAIDNPREFVVKGVFEDSYNYMKSGTLLRQVVNKLNEIDFHSQEERHLFNDIYETILQSLQSAGNAGEFYTPRPVTQFIVDMVNPKLGQTVFDPACGTGGFLICALEHLKKKLKNVEDIRILQKTVSGVEKKPLPHLLATTNMIIHDIDVPKIKHDNSLIKNVREYKSDEKKDIIITNPPFGGTEEGGIEVNFPTQFRTKETADLFLVLIMYLLKDGGKSGVVLPDGFMFGEGIKTAIKEKLLNDFNLHTIIRLPKGVFSPYTNINTNLLFFDKTGSTKEVWFFEHPLPEGYKNYTKRKPIQHNEFQLEKDWWKRREENDFAWKVSLSEIKDRNYNFDIRNPTKSNAETILSASNIIDKLKIEFQKSTDILDEISKSIKK